MTETLKRHLYEIKVTTYLGYDICAEISKRYFKANKKYFRITIPVIRNYIKDKKEFTLDEVSKKLNLRKVDLFIALKYEIRKPKIEEVGKRRYRVI